MATNYPAAVAESATINASDATIIDLASSAASIGGFTARTFAQAVTDGDLVNGDTVMVTVQVDATNWAQWLAVYDSAVPDLTRSTLLVSKGTISTSDSVTVFVSSDPDKERLTYSSISPTTANVTAAVNTLYDADISGLTARRNFVLPAGEAGDRITIHVNTGDDTYELVLIGDTGISINGGTAATEWSNLFISGETVTFYAVSATNWIVENDGRIPCCARIDSSGNQSIATTTATKFTTYSAATLDNGNCWASGTFTARRAANGISVECSVLAAGLASGSYQLNQVYVNGVLAHKTRISENLTSYSRNMNSYTHASAADGDYLEIYVQHNHGSNLDMGVYGLAFKELLS